MNKGYIKLHRQILDSEVFASQKMLKIWVWCLCKANHKINYVPIKKGKGEMTVKLKKGEFLFGRFKAEEELFIDGSTIYKIMKKLEQLGNILIKSNNHYSIVTICNYNQYQDIKEGKVTAKEQLTDSKVTAKSQLSNTYKNEENEENEKEEVKIDFEIFWNLYDKKVGKKEKVKTKWDKLNIKVQQGIVDYIPKYIKAQPNKKYRKDPETFFNNESWKDEIITGKNDKEKLLEYYKNEINNIKTSNGKSDYKGICKIIFQDTKQFGKKLYFLQDIQKPLSFKEYEYIRGAFSQKEISLENVLEKIAEKPDYYKNKESVFDIFKMFF